MMSVSALLPKLLHAHIHPSSQTIRCSLLLQHEWQPVKSLVRALRSKYSEYAVFFYNEFAPDVIALIWRPDAFKPQPFSAIVSEFKRPGAEVWKEDSLAIANTDDLMAEIGHFSRNIVSNFKVREPISTSSFSFSCYSSPILQQSRINLLCFASFEIKTFDDKKPSDAPLVEKRPKMSHQADEEKDNDSSNSSDSEEE